MATLPAVASGPRGAPPLYTANPYHPWRRPTRVVMVGSVGVGGDHPIRVQSMTTTRTQDIDATTAQAIRLVEAGCEIVRITAPTVADARAIGEVRTRLRALGITTPLVADIHFSPAAALAAAENADKVRVNPGNFADSRKFAVREYSDDEYAAELERVAARFTPVVLACKERGVALRIGTNHGSLSDRVMNRFGDSPEGMVESALEFVRICEAHRFYEIILSMKASNAKVMIAAYRLLTARMDEEGMPAYPLHLGVTEAGNGDDARIKSAAGIGSLLLDGLGDTIRVSLAEEPEEEIPAARAIAALCTRPLAPNDTPAHGNGASPPLPYNPYHYRRRPSRPVTLGGLTIGNGEQIAVA
ncbi:MAG: (E)-4-hydroxy-3-methylbut-2-enyl-diphosphate synthase, partial [Chloroflexota bacterium]